MPSKFRRQRGDVVSPMSSYYSSITHHCNIRTPRHDRRLTPFKRPPLKRQSPSFPSIITILQHSYFTIFITIIIITITTFTTVQAQDSNHYFCGTSWDDASNNCNERQHCVGGTDDECETDGHICFGGTTCDVREGHGNKFKFANVAYGDISNTRFCGLDWAAAIDDCSLATHCPTGFSEECPDGASCYGGLSCNVQDILEEMEELEGEAAASGKGPTIPKHSPKRHNFCGMSWGDANEKCGEWCPEGENTDCPGGMGCFGNTGCYYSDDLVPTATPVQEPTIAPSTVPPVTYLDPANVRYCGITWAMALANCSVETHCPSGSEKDCPKGQTCHAGLSQCNMQDLLAKEEKVTVPTFVPTPSPITKQDPSNSKFCGKSWDTAKDGCSLDTHCPNDECPEGLICYGGIGCNASEMTKAPSLKPTPQPTDTPTITPTAPTLSPSVTPTTRTRAPVTEPPTITSVPTPAPLIPANDIRHSFWCGESWADVAKNCHEPCLSGQDTECPDEMVCFSFTACRPATPKPTRKPTTPKPTNTPSPPPTPLPTVPATKAPTSKPTWELFTMRPTTQHPTGNPSEYYAAEIEDTAEVIQPDSKPEPIVTVQPSPKPAPLPELTVTVLTVQPSPMPAPLPEPIVTLQPSPKTSTLEPSGKPSPEPTRNPTQKPTNPPLSALPPSSANIPAPSHDLMATVGSILVSAESGISNDVLLRLDMMTSEKSPTQLYQYGGFINALGTISKGDMGSSYFYLGPNVNGAEYGLANVALFLAQAAVETVQFDVCDDISWEKDVFGLYPLANSCGQGRFVGTSKVLYEDSNHCADDEAFMACPVDAEMTAVAESHGIFVGAPPPLECFPSTLTQRFTGGWDPSLSCPNDGCSSYEGQTMGNIDPLSIPSANSFGRKHVEGCCWWGRGAFPRGSAGTCMIGRLNYYLGKRAFNEGRASARYKEIDFCKDPSAICRGHYDDKEKNAEMRWIMGMQYWINKVQTYNVEGWSYLEKLHSFTDGGMNDIEFLEDVSRIVTRGCHDCGNAVSSIERRDKFNKIINHFGSSPESSLPTQRPMRLPSKKPTFSPIFNPTTPSTLAPVSNPSTSLLTPPPVDLPTPKPMIPPTLAPVSNPSTPPTSLLTPPPVDLPTPKPMIPTVTFPVNPTNRPNPPSTDHPTLRPIMRADPPPTVSPVSFTTWLDKFETSSPVSGFPKDDYQLTPSELSHRLNFANNYCASSLEEAEVKCATSLRTCNFEDPPCRPGLQCLGNVVCSINWSTIDFVSAEKSPSGIETTEQRPSEPETAKESSFELETGKDSPHESDSFSDAVSCNGICLLPLRAIDCMAAGEAIAVPNCLSATIGEMCETNECKVGDHSNISNCPGGRNLFMRVFAEQCSVSTSNSSSSINGSHHSLSPTNHTSQPSSKPSSSSGYGWNEKDTNRNVSNPADSSFGDYDYDSGAYSGLPRNDGSGPGAWWEWNNISGSVRPRMLPMLSLLSITTALALMFANT